MVESVKSVMQLIQPTHKFQTILPLAATIAGVTRASNKPFEDAGLLSALLNALGHAASVGLRGGIPRCLLGSLRPASLLQRSRPRQALREGENLLRGLLERLLGARRALPGDCCDHLIVAEAA